MQFNDQYARISDKTPVSLAVPDKGYEPRTYWIMREHHVTGESQDVAESQAPTPESDYPAQRKLLDELRQTCLKLHGTYTGNKSFIAGEWGYHMVVRIGSRINRITAGYNS